MSEGFAAIPNWMFRDESISLYALTVYGALASHSGPGGIHPSQRTLAAEARCSDRQVRRALVELEELGVVERVMRKNSRGRATTGYTLHPNGRLRADEESSEVPDSQSGTAPGVPDSQSGGSGLPVRGFRTGATNHTPCRRRTPEEEPLKKNPYSPHDDFELFWSIYPRRAGKQAALAAFVKALNAGATPEDILKRPEFVGGS
ncbi:helix-turn-helix domain-containing protein [Agrococcus sp. SCSIO52902]|uniref:helix-turn-helix domain-containing protein n=1 Tax=Agrococcus sp. SCSIO52902 TaxID=2933290 RepID=UPI001FF21230|nr:helix-turn-helix domain-containing protein [Agrococcus sp. SCSIO52902]UOW00893.1 helix-turn-helix domain-containing protein [Agrococcus sp. SCSIO52902]